MADIGTDDPRTAQTANDSRVFLNGGPHDQLERAGSCGGVIEVFRIHWIVCSAGRTAAAGTARGYILSAKAQLGPGGFRA